MNNEEVRTAWAKEVLGCRVLTDEELNIAWGTMRANGMASHADTKPILLFRDYGHGPLVTTANYPYVDQVLRECFNRNLSVRIIRVQEPEIESSDQELYRVFLRDESHPDKEQFAHMKRGLDEAVAEALILYLRNKKS